MAGTSLIRMIFINILVLVVLVVLLFGGYIYYTNSINYVSTNDAQVTGQMVPVTVPYGGKLASWYGAVNSTVIRGDVLGTEGRQSVLALNPELLPLIAHNASAAANLSDSETIVSPISGTIVQNNAYVGEVVQPGQILAEVIDMGNLNITANIPETSIRHLSVGQSVDVTVDAFPNTTFQGTVQNIGDITTSSLSLVPNISAGSGSYTKVQQRIPVIISLNGGYTGKTLIPGMSAHVTIHVNNY